MTSATAPNDGHGPTLDLDRILTTVKRVARGVNQRVASVLQSAQRETDTQCDDRTDDHPPLREQ